MKSLAATWLTDGLIDFEYKKYLLLDYLQASQTEFDSHRLYPVFSDLIMHYQNLVQIRDHKKLVYEQFPKRISKADFEKLELVYEKMAEDDAIMQQIEEIIEFATPRFSKVIHTGKEIYDQIESQLEINPVGITPIYKNEGYLFLENSFVSETQIYQYQISVFENTYEKYRGINTKLLETVRRGLTDTHENLKVRLAKSNKEFPNPAVFAIITKHPFPLEQALLPIAKRTLVKYVSNMAA